MTDNNVSNPTSQASDGRRQRSSRSRNKIAQAMFELLGEGEMSPSAVSVASRANVGLRTVFRHFDDMDAIYSEMVDQAMARVLPKAEAPYVAKDWQGRLLECVERRSEIYEMIFPAKVALSLRRFHSDFLMDRYEKDTAMQREMLRNIVPKAIRTDKSLFAALEVTLAFSTWRRLRQDQNLSVSEAKRTLTSMILKMTDGHSK